MAKLHGDDILVWPDGDWMYRCEYYRSGGDWLSDDFSILLVDSVEWQAWYVEEVEVGVRHESE